MYLFRSTPLNCGDLLPISSTAAALARERFGSLNLVLGHQLQYTHDEIFHVNGFDASPSAGAELFDRTYAGIIQDDKVATWSNGQLSATHTLSHWEELRWNREWKEHERDVIIQSFEYTDASHMVARYMGAISWRAIRTFTYQSISPEQKYFNREQAYKWSLIRVE